MLNTLRKPLKSQRRQQKSTHLSVFQSIPEAELQTKDRFENKTLDGLQSSKT